jgi:hypothetical protein
MTKKGEIAPAAAAGILLKLIVLSFRTSKFETTMLYD